jgi:putative oxidoreductase
MASNPSQATIPDKAVIIIRAMVGAVFLSEGIQKFLFAAQLGAGRFAKLGIPHPEFFGPSVGLTEFVCGIALILGLWLRLAVLPLLVVISVAIATTKWPEILAQGFWPTAHDGRADFCMLLGLIFLLFKGAGAWSLDGRKGDGNTS